MREDVEALARALGVRRGGRGDNPLTRGKPFSLHWITGTFVLTLASGARRVDTPTAAVVLLGHARGLRVDIGECLACRGSGTEWMAADAAPPVHQILHDANGWAWRVAAGRYERRCRACTVDGQPTGRHTVAWERAIIDAVPKRAEVSPVAGEWGPVGQAMERARLGAFVYAGDEKVRTPLAVLADQHQARGDILGTFVAEWLAGSCPVCEGVGRERLVQFGQATNHWLTDKTCKRCHGYGTMLGQREPELRACLQAAAVIAEAAPDERATVPA